MSSSAIATIPISFDALPSETFVARFWNYPGIPDHFSEFKSAVKCLRIPKNAVLSNYGAKDALQKSMPLATARMWGISYPEDRIFYAKARGEDGSWFCLRFIFNANRVAANKRSPKHQIYLKLINDAKFYANHAKIAASIFIPMHFGLWLMETGEFAGTVLVSITRWCGVPWKTLMKTRYDTEANRILVGRTLEMMHDVGFEFDGSLGYYRNFTNILVDLDHPRHSEEDRLNGRARCYISDLSEARVHDCQRRLPVLPFGSHVVPEDFGCEELGNAAFLLGLVPLNRGPYVIDAHAAEAVDWYDEYYESHETYANWAVLVAQRAKMFPGHPPVFRGLRISLDDDEKADLTLSEIASSLAVLPAETLATCTRLELASRIFPMNFRQDAAPLTSSQ